MTHHSFVHSVTEFLGNGKLALNKHETKHFEKLEKKKKKQNRQKCTNTTTDTNTKNNMKAHEAHESPQRASVIYSDTI